MDQSKPAQATPARDEREPVQESKQTSNNQDSAEPAPAPVVYRDWASI